MDTRIIESDIIFNAKVDAVPFNYRISYKVSLIILIIGKCCGRKGCSAIKLQMISSSATTSKKRRELLDSVQLSFFAESTLVRFDPAISRAINFALADKLIYRQGNGLFRLTTIGKELLTSIYSDANLMFIEKQFFSELSNKLTEEMIENFSWNWRTEQNVEN
ncbi:hypothetical protein JI92_08835 [Listeria monocytogenes]|uniref:Uncharacterized protein n=1 Tax=Listeria immobilis TaxID=2713502 RepID=A0A7X0X9B9_9LIST|nr:hypothetical protein [Listeria immobilis]EAC5201543.1 hypothetical protein [Listeria monocytogenes]EDO1159039.1 hypothetical protein [Listeria innocua]EAC8537617.1 hypothetical protein [Listeria monocytogenes]EAC8553015.1 hypothetical protein [Listeria monocytogenes]EAC8975955.1 hypothetical protein [Listeria monocytogenes]